MLFEQLLYTSVQSLGAMGVFGMPYGARSVQQVPCHHIGVTHQYWADQHVPGLIEDGQPL